jgi:hypothetical protein
VPAKAAIIIGASSADATVEESAGLRGDRHAAVDVHRSDASHGRTILRDA